MRPLLGHRWSVFAVAFAPDDPTCLASAGTDRVVRVWDTTTGAVTREVRGPGLGEVRRLAWTPSGRFLVGGDRLGQAFRWEQTTGEFLVQPLEPGRAVSGLVVLDEGPRLLATGAAGDRPGGPGYLARWHLLTRAATREMWPAAIRAVAAEPDGPRLALAEEGRRVVVADRDALHRPGWVTNPPSTAVALAFAPGQLAVARGMVIDLWDLATREHCRTLAGHRSVVTCLAVTPDGRLLLSGGQDRKVRVWSLPDGGPVAAHDWEVGPVTGLAVAPDGQTAAACGEKAAVVVWDLDYRC